MTGLAAEGGWPRARLDADYTAKDCVSDEDFARIIADYARLSAPAAGLPGARTGLVYDGSGERLDLFGTAPGERRPLFLFLHGGYWRALSRGHSAFMAPMLAARGIACAVPDYTLAPAADLTEIVRQCRAALVWLWRNADDLGIGRGRIVVGGSSAGGHLAAVLAMPGWQAAMGLPVQPLAGMLPVSGLYDLAPIAACHPQDWLHLTPAEVATLSPLRAPPPALRAVTALAENETPGFTRQSAAWAAATGAPLLTVPGRNHFDVILDLAQPDTALSRALLRLF